MLEAVKPTTPVTVMTIIALAVAALVAFANDTLGWGIPGEVAAAIEVLAIGAAAVFTRSAKVLSSTLVTAALTVLIFVLDSRGIEVPADGMALASAAFAFAFGWIADEWEDDGIVRG